MDSKNDARGKRKLHPSNSNSDRPMKQRKPQPPVDPEDDDFREMNGDASSRGGPGNGVVDAFSDDEAPVLGKLAAVAETKEWQATIEKVVRNVVSIVSASEISADG